MRTIKIFLASSEELAEERIRFGDFIRQLDDMYEVRDYRIKLYKWEDLPSGDNGKPKQDEYNEKVSECDMFVGLFHTKAGPFTLEEYETAKRTQKNEGKPTLYIFCRELAEGEKEDTSLTEFKARLLNDIRHYWNKYNNSDSLKLQFILQLMMVENRHWDNLTVKNGSIRFGELEIAQMDSLYFAVDNRDYQRMRQRLLELPFEIKDVQQLINDHPDRDRYQDKLQKLLAERDCLEEDFNKQQKFLLDTAKRIATIQGTAITDRKRRAIEAFEKGDVREANIILDEEEKDGDARFVDFEMKEELREKEIRNIHSDIECLLIQTTVVMADATIPIQERIDKTIGLYKKADYRAAHTNYDEEKYNDMLFNYASFLYRYGLYDDAEKIFHRHLQLNITINGINHISIAASYNNIGLVCREAGLYSNALKFHIEALMILEKVYGKKHPYTATIYNNIGSLYWKQGDFSMAIEYHEKALIINEAILGSDHLDTAKCYENIGTVYHEQGVFLKAKECYQRALEIKEKVLGPEHTETASIYNNYGMLLRDQGDYRLALSYFMKALKIREKNLVYGDRNTITSYNCIITVFDKLGDYPKALEYIEKVLKIREETLGIEHIETSYSYKDLGSVYDELKDYPRALYYYQKALSIMGNKLGTDNLQIATLYNIIGMVYQKQGDYDKALEYYEKALLIREKTLGLESEDIADSYNNIGSVYYKMEKYQESLEYYLKSLMIDEKLYGTSHPITIEDYHNIGALYSLLGNWEKALEFLEKAKEL